MKKLLFFTAIFATIHAFATIKTDSIESKVLGEWVKYNVYTPENFDTSGKTKYPVLYLLHGLSDTYAAWNNNAQLGEVADELLAQGKICEMVIIMPNAGGPDTYNTWNGYFNMPGHNYEDFFFTELLPAVEKKYNIYGDKKHRAVSGLSMGGGGSTVYCQRHPDMFGSCYAMSAWLDDSSQLQDNRPNKRNIVIKAVKDHSALRFIKEADAETINKLNTIKWYFDIGDRDFLVAQSKKLYALMCEKNINAELRVRPGIHNWHFWKVALYNSLPFATKVFQGK